MAPFRVGYVVARCGWDALRELAVTKHWSASTRMLPLYCADSFFSAPGVVSVVSVGGANYVWYGVDMQSASGDPSTLIYIRRISLIARAIAIFVGVPCVQLPFAVFVAEHTRAATRAAAVAVRERVRVGSTARTAPAPVPVSGSDHDGDDPVAPTSRDAETTAGIDAEQEGQPSAAAGGLSGAGAEPVDPLPAAQDVSGGRSESGEQEEKDDSDDNPPTEDPTLPFSDLAATPPNLASTAESSPPAAPQGSPTHNYVILYCPEEIELLFPLTSLGDPYFDAGTIS
jgi:hypothetical protein